MNKTLLRLIGIAGGFLLIFLALNQFLKSYYAGEPKWYNLVMISGMALLLYYTLFWSSKNRDTDDKDPESKPEE